jgi:PAS domain S-box-containing protein
VKYGAYRAFQVRGIPIRNERDEIVEWRGALTDVQDTIDIKSLLRDAHKDLAETLQALRISEARSRTQAEQLRALSDELRATLNTAGIGIARCSRDLCYLNANETYATITGFPLLEIIGRPIVEVMGEAAIATILPYMERVLTGERVEYETVIPYRKGVPNAFFRVVNVPDRDPKGSVIGWIACVADITASRRAELALAERNAQLALAERNAQLALVGRAALVGCYAFDVNKGEMQISEGYAVIHGLPERTTETTRREWRDRLHPEDIGRLDELRSQTFSDRRGEYNVEYRIVLPNRGVRWIESRSFISYDGDGNAQRVVGVDIDVTERRRTEQALTDRNRQLELAAKAALVGRYAIEIEATREDFTSHRIHFSPGFAAIYGLPEATVEISVGDWRSLVHPDDLPQFVKHRQQLFAERRVEHHAEHRIVRPCGTIRWIEVRSFIEYDQAGRAKRMVGVNIDITERKRAEEARKIVNAELDHRVKNALSTVAAVISRTRQGSRSVADFAAALEGRIRSMAATHELLSSRHWQELSLIELIRRELAPYAASKNTEISGPTVLLKKSSPLNG